MPETLDHRRCGARSQGYGVVEHVGVPGAERGGLDDVDSYPEELLQVQDQAGDIQEGATWLEVDEEVDVARAQAPTLSGGPLASAASVKDWLVAAPRLKRLRARTLSVWHRLHVAEGAEQRKGRHDVR